MEKVQHALLISLIVVLGVIMYLRLLRNLKNKRKTASFSFIEGYDKIDGTHVIKYNIGESESSDMVIEDTRGNELSRKTITHEISGTFETVFTIPDIQSEYVLLKWHTKNQKIVKKIYLEV